jgi:hypothetical protein
MSLSILLRHTRSVADGGRDIHPIKWRAKYGGMGASLDTYQEVLVHLLRDLGAAPEAYSAHAIRKFALALAGTPIPMNVWAKGPVRSWCQNPIIPLISRV